MTVYVSAHQVDATNRATLEQLSRAIDDVRTRGGLRTFAVTGSRQWFDWRTMWAALALLDTEAEMFNGMADGADTLARVFWWAQGGTVRPFHAKWRLGRHAGITRNTIMAEHMPQLTVAFLRHDLPSPGTRDMIRQAQERGIPVFTFHQFIADPERSQQTDSRDRDTRKARGVS